MSLNMYFILYIGLLGLVIAFIKGLSAHGGGLGGFDSDG
jgi:hypothetical protein